MSAAGREYYEEWQEMLTEDPDFFTWLDKLENGDERDSDDSRQRIQNGSTESL